MIRFSWFDATPPAWILLGTVMVGAAVLVVLGGRRGSFPAATIGGAIAIGAILWAGPGVAQSVQELAERAQARAQAAQAQAQSWMDQSQGREATYAAQAQALVDGNSERLRAGFKLLDDSQFKGGSAMADLAKAPQDGVVYVAVSFSMPPNDLRRLARDANAAGATLVIRGLVDGSFAKTLEATKQVFNEASPNGMAIDPQVFRAYHIDQVPVFIAAKTPVQPCGAGLDCVSAQPPSDQVRGNISLGEALKILSERGDQARDIAAAARRRMES
jgi:conjugal transfer pilus assembly protein TrbC